MLRTPVVALLLALPAGPLPAVAGEPPAPRLIEEIIVTATKREELLQQVPVAVTAIGGLPLERLGLRDLRDLGRVSPSFMLNASQTESQGTTLRLRGVGTTGNNVGLESAVGVFVDGLYLSRPGVALGDLLEMERIEVLRGPQGTLFGRNTSAGALNITTRAPDTAAAELWASATAGNFDAHALALGGNLPVVDERLAFRLAGIVRQQDGFLHSTAGAESLTRDRYTLRGQMRWVVSPSADLRVIADYAEVRDQCCDAVMIYETPLVAAGAYAAAGLPADGGVLASGESALRNRRSNGGQFRNPSEQWGVGATLDGELGGISVIYLGGYRDYRASSVQSDFVGIDVYSQRPEAARGWDSVDEISTWTDELRFSGEWGRLDWLVGAYHARERIRSRQGIGLGSDFSRNASAVAWYGGLFPAFATGLPALSAAPLATGGTFGDVLAAEDPALAFAGGIDPAGAFAQNAYRQDSRAWSLFAHHRLALTERLELVAGLRHGQESKEGRFAQAQAQNDACLATLANGAALAAAAPGVASATVQGVSAAFMCFPFATPADTGIPGLPATFDRTFRDDGLTYTLSASYALNDRATGYASFTRGAKSGGFNLDASAAAGDADPRFRSEIVDAWEVGLKAEPWDRRLRANLALFAMEMEDFQVLAFTGLQFVTFNVPKARSRGAELELQAVLSDRLDVSLAITYADARYPGNCAPDTAPGPVRQLCGGQLTNAPEWVALAGFNYDRPIGNRMSYFIAASARWEDDRRTTTQWRTSPAADAPRLLFDIQEAHAKVNLRAGLGGSDGRWSIELWGENLFDQQTRGVTANTPLRGADVFGTASRIAFIDAPRTYGMTVRLRL